ncbi:hypothetical protein ACKWTF_014028 [Chironomus riparius]
MDDVIDPNDHETFHKSQHAIAQLNELQVCRRLAVLEQQRHKREEEWSYLKDLKKIVPHIDITKDSTDDQYRWEFSKNLMMSEWMMEEPDDLEDFLLVPCPKGTRSTLIHELPPDEPVGFLRRPKFLEKKPHYAKLYSKTGHKLLEVKTNIPPDTILDCFYVKKIKTIYILDCMKYDGRDLTNCDTAFRRYWIGSKFYECRLGVIDIRVPKNELKLDFLEGFEFKQPHRVHHCFQRMPYFHDFAELDGYLFYHKDCSYTPGESPLVLWLFPFMIDEVLTMFRVHKDYNTFKPDNYTNYIEFIEKFNVKKEEKNKKRFKNKKKNQEDERDKNQVGSPNEISFEDNQPCGTKRILKKNDRFDEDLVK